MNLLPPAIAAALLRAETGLPPGGGLPQSGQELSLGSSSLANLLSGSGPVLPFSNLAQILAGSGPRARVSRVAASPEEPLSNPGLLPASVQALLPAYLQPDQDTSGYLPGLPPQVREMLPIYLQQPTPEAGLSSIPAPQSPTEETAVANEEAAGNEAPAPGSAFEGLFSRPFTGPMRTPAQIQAIREELQRQADAHNAGTFNFQNEPSGEENLPLGVQQYLGAMPSGEGE